MKHPVFKEKNVPAWDGSEPLLVDTVDLEKALWDNYNFDAFITGYIMVDTDGSIAESMPRLNRKKSAGGIESIRRSGGDVFMSTVFIDLDRNPHEPWNSDQEAQKWVEAIATQLPEAAVYSTNAGMRVVLKLRQLAALEDYEKIARVALRRVEAEVRRVFAPLEVDKASIQWDRLFRLPHVVRKGESTVDRAFLHVPDPWPEWSPGLADLHTAEQEIQARVEEREMDLPDEKPAYSERLKKTLQAMVIGGPKGSRRAAKKVLEGELFFKTGDRNNATYRFIQKLYYFARTTAYVPPAEEVLGVLWDSIEKSPGTAPREALNETLGMCLRTEARSAATLEVQQARALVAVAATKDNNPPVVYNNKARFIYDSTTRSYSIPVTDTQTFIAEVVRFHPAKTLNDKNQPLPVHEILRTLGVRITDIKYVLGQKRSTFSQNKGKNSLRIGVAPLPDIAPEFHADVDEWLKALVQDNPDEETQEKFFDWLATCRQIHKPTTALILQGVGGAGKDMLAGALSQIFGGKAEFSKALSRFNSALMNSALIHLSEGVPDDKNAMPVSMRFREIVGGGELAIEQKGIDPISMAGNYRVFVTSNNPRPIPVQDTRTMEDFEAVANRVLHVHASRAATNLLARNGGRDYTADWVAIDTPDGQVPGKIAQHIAWLEENHDVKHRGDRFLVPANVGKWHITELLQGILRDVLKAIGVAAASQSASRVAIVREGKILASAGQHMAGYINNLQSTKYEPPEVTTAIERSLSVGAPRRVDNLTYYEMPHHLILSVLRPEYPDVFVEAQRLYTSLVNQLERSEILREVK